MDSQGGPGRAGSLVVELAARTVIVDGTRVELPPTEFALLAVLATRPGEVVTHKELLEEAFGDSAYMNTQDLHWRIWNIRKLIGDADKKTIRNRRGVGFVLESSRVEVLDGVAEATADAPSHVIRLEPEAPEPETAQLEEPKETNREPRRPFLVLSPAALVIVALVAALVLGGSWLAGYTLSQKTEPPATAVAPPPEVEKPDQDVTKNEKREDRRRAKNRNRSRKKRDAPRSPGSPNFAVGPSGNVVPEEVTSGNQPLAPSNDSKDAQPKSDGPSKQEQAPPPPPPPQPNAQLYHLHNPDTRDHIMTTSSSVANQKQAAGYASTPAGGVFTSQVKGTVAIALDGGTAYVYSSPSSAPDEVRVTALYRLSSSDDFFYTTSSSAANQAQAQGWGRSTAGYVAT